MQAITCRYHQLDPDTQEYLRDVHTAAGKRCPGIYIEEEPNPFGKIALGCGPLLLLVGLIVSFNTNKDAYAAAMFLSGTVLLGGWLTWFGLRELMAESGDRFHGQFVYFDPTHVYRVAGDEVSVTSVGDFRHAIAKQTGVLISLERGNVFVPIGRPAKVELVARFYKAILSIEEHDDPKWKKLSTAETGGVAKHIAVEGGFPISKDSANLNVEFVPEEPRSEHGQGLPIGLLVAFGGAAFVFLCGLLMFKPVRDSGHFAEAKENGAPGLRSYLMDERNTANRAEAKRLLAALYDAPIAKVRAAVPDEQAVARDGIIALLESLRVAPQPVVSIQVTESSELEGREYRQSQARTDIADALGLYLGKDLIAFAKNPDDRKAHLEITYVPQANGEVTWTAAFRTAIDGEATTTPEQTLGPSPTAGIPAALKTAFFQTFFKTAAPAVPPLPPIGEF